MLRRCWVMVVVAVVKEEGIVFVPVPVVLALGGGVPASSSTQ